jgi:hypothetical protein
MNGAPRKVLCTQCLTHSCVCSLRLAGLGGHAASVLGDTILTFIAAQHPAYREDRESPCDRWRQTGNFEVVSWSSLTNMLLHTVHRAFLPWADARRAVPIQRGLRMIGVLNASQRHQDETCVPTASPCPLNRNDHQPLRSRPLHMMRRSLVQSQGGNDFVIVTLSSTLLLLSWRRSGVAERDHLGAGPPKPVGE